MQRLFAVFGVLCLVISLVWVFIYRIGEGSGHQNLTRTNEWPHAQGVEWQVWDIDQAGGQPRITIRANRMGLRNQRQGVFHFPFQKQTVLFDVEIRVADDGGRLVIARSKEILLDTVFLRDQLSKVQEIFFQEEFSVEGIDCFLGGKEGLIDFEKQRIICTKNCQVESEGGMRERDYLVISLIDGKIQK